MEREVRGITLFSVLWGYVSAPKNYFKKEKENGNERTDHQQ